MAERGSTLRTVRDPLIGLVAQLLLMTALAGTVGLGRAGWVVGAACASYLRLSGRKAGRGR